MKKTKKIVALVVVLVMMLAVVATVLTACDNSNTVIWVSESDGVAELTKQQIQEFNKTWTGEFKISARVEGVSESKSATSMISDVENGADIFCFAHDQLARLVQAKAVTALTGDVEKKILAENDDDSIAASKVAGKVYCFPITSDNGYFMIYDKSVVKAEHVDDLAAIVKDCEDANKMFSMELETSAWYVASFFFGAGCKSEWTTDANGKFIGAQDDFNSDNGLIALKGMQILSKSKAHNSSSNADDFNKSSAVVVTGTWGINAAKAALGDNLGVAKLPCFTVDGQSYQMGSFKGCKLMGVKPQTDPQKAAAMIALAQYLSSEECQLQRHTSFGWGPSNKVAQANSAVKNDAVLQALNAQNGSDVAVTQMQIHGSWWDIAKKLGTVAKNADLGDETALRAGLVTYKEDIEKALAKSPAELRAWAVIGNLNGDSWGTDWEMIESPENTWISKDAFELTATSEFKVRQGGSWDVNLGGDGKLNGANATLATFGKSAGTYKIKIVVELNSNGDVVGGVMSLIEA